MAFCWEVSIAGCLTLETVYMNISAFKIYMASAIVYNFLTGKF